MTEVETAPQADKNVAIFDDFISSNNTNDDFDEITATLGDVDAYIELQQKLQATRGKRGGGGGGGRGGKKGGGGDEDEGDAGNEGGGKRGGGGGRGGQGGGRGGGEGAGRGGGGGGRGGGEGAGRGGGGGGRGGGEGAGRGGGEGAGRGGGGGRGGGEGAGRGGGGGRGGGEGGGRGGGEGAGRGGEGVGRGGGGGGRGGGEGAGRGGGGGGRGGGEGAGRGGGEGAGRGGGGGGRGGGEGAGRGGRGGGEGGGRGGRGGGQEGLRRRNVNGGGEHEDIDELKRQAHQNGEGPKGGRGGKGGKGGKRKGGGRGKATVSALGVAVMLTGTFCMSGAMTTTKMAAKLAPVVQVRFLRSVFCLILSIVYAKGFMKKSLSLGDIDNKKSLLMRVGMTVFQTFAQMYVARKLPLGLTAALMGMSPVTTSILNRIVLGTKMDASQWLCTLTTVAGVMLISQPAFIFGDSSANEFEEYDMERMIAICLAVVMNVMRALTMILNKKMMMAGGGRLHFSQFTFYNSLMALFLCFLVQGPMVYKLVQIPTLEAIAYIMVGACLFFARPILMDVGLGARLPTSLITILRSSSIIWAFIFQLLLFGEIPSVMEATGISIIVGCATTMYHLTGQE